MRGVLPSRICSLVVQAISRRRRLAKTFASTGIRDTATLIRLILNRNRSGGLDDGVIDTRQTGPPGPTFDCPNSDPGG